MTEKAGPQLRPRPERMEGISPSRYVHSSFTEVPNVIVPCASSDAFDPRLVRVYSVSVPTTVLCVWTPVDDELNTTVALVLLSPHFGAVIVPITPLPLTVNPRKPHVNKAKFPFAFGVTSRPGPGVPVDGVCSTVRRWNGRLSVVMVPAACPDVVHVAPASLQPVKVCSNVPVVVLVNVAFPELAEHSTLPKPPVRVATPTP
jgi:hypothetical protein